MNHHRFFVFLLIFFISAVNIGASTKLYDGWLLEGSTIQISNEELYRTALDPDWEKLFISGETESFILENNTCEFGAYRKICFYGARFDLDKNYGRFDYLAAKKIPEIHVLIEDISPKITIKQTVDKATLALNTDATLTVTITNTGTESASFLEFSEEYPSGVILTSTSPNVNIEPNRFTIKFPSLLNVEKIFKIKMRETEPVNFTLNGNLSYSFRDRKYTVAIPQLKIYAAAPPSIGIKETWSKTSLKIGEPVTLHINLSNPTKAEAKITSVVIDVPEGILIKKIPEEMTLSKRSAAWHGTLAKNLSRLFDMTLLPYYSGSYSINISANGEVIDEATSEYIPFTQKKELKVTVPLKRLKPTIGFMLNRKSLKSGQLSNAKVYVKNEDSDVTFFDISYQITSDLFNTTQGTIEFLPPNTKSQILFHEFVTGYPNVTKKYYVNLTVRYRTVYNEFFDESLSDWIEVKPEEEEKIIEITQTLPTEIEWNESAIVTVNVKNLQTKSVSGTKVSDKHEGAEVLSGSESILLGQLNAGEKKTAYTYKIVPLSDDNSTSIIIQTMVEFMYQGNTYTIHKEASIEVNRSFDIPNVSISPDEASKVNLSKEETQETPTKDTMPESRKKPSKAGIMERVIGFFINFFGKIF